MSPPCCGGVLHQHKFGGGDAGVCRRHASGLLQQQRIGHDAASMDAVHCGWRRLWCDLREGPLVQELVGRGGGESGACGDVGVRQRALGRQGCGPRAPRGLAHCRFRAEHTRHVASRRSGAMAESAGALFAATGQGSLQSPTAAAAAGCRDAGPPQGERPRAAGVHHGEGHGVARLGWPPDPVRGDVRVRELPTRRAVHEVSPVSC
mmetsp:Transcript_67668/g.195934  ORF Transcript_67668/g.195934 Transcript_67668/m.195934 type:complete len:206 (+) Transcript_67668:151-768(+)